jgi:arabinogalactan oligomer/maltooligosaccharide transport system substrate-binding protein
MKKKLFVVAVMMLAMAFVLAACAPATPAPTIAAPATAAPATQAPAAATEAPMATEAPTEAPAAQVMAPVDLVMWSQDQTNIEDTVMSMFQAWAATNAPGSTLTITHYETEDLRTNFQTAALAGTGPDFMWTVNDHAGPFTAAGLIQPVDDLVDLSVFVEPAVKAVELNGQHWGIPVENGNHLMLLYNKSLIQTPPTTTDELVSMAQGFTGDVQGFAYNENEPFWLAPWWGGYGGSVFAADGVTPTLNTDAMISAFTLVQNFKFQDKILPAECDYNCADTLFKQGQVAMIINGDWSLGDYTTALGDNLGVARIPDITGAGTPAPYTSGKFFMLPLGLEGDKKDAVLSFIKYMTEDVQNQIEINVQFSRLPALTAALSDPSIANDPILAGSADQMKVGVPMPVVPQMRCVWDSIRPNLEGVMGNSETPADAAAAAQTAADTCVADLGS